jgi:hypothetical protein
MYIEGQAGHPDDVFGRGDLDASNLGIRHLVGWSESTNRFYILSQIYDNVHFGKRVNEGNFYHDDSIEYGLNPDHTDEAEQNEGDVINGISYKIAPPPSTNPDWESAWYRPGNIRALPWLVPGSKWHETGFGYTGDEFGESIYFYESSISPISEMPNSKSATEEQVVEHDFQEGEVIHWGAQVNDVDEGDGTEDNRHIIWATSPGCCHGGATDVLLSPIDDDIWGGMTAVSPTSWARIKAQF